MQTLTISIRSLARARFGGASRIPFAPRKESERMSRGIKAMEGNEVERESAQMNQVFPSRHLRRTVPRGGQVWKRTGIEHRVIGPFEFNWPIYRKTASVRAIRLVVCN